MYELDFLKAGDKKDADAICLRFDRPDGGGRAVVVIDAGWQDDGDSVVDFVRHRFGTDRGDPAIVSHPDGDHIGGMGKVVRELDVAGLLVHRLDQRGGAALDAGGAVADLVKVAAENGTPVGEPFQGARYLGGALSVLSPSEAYYDELISEQRLREAQKTAEAAPGVLASLAQATLGLADRALGALPVEIPFGEGRGPGPRNNSSTVILFAVEDFRALLTADAGVPALEAAIDFAPTLGLEAAAAALIQTPHPGSRRNASSPLLDRLLAPIGQEGVGSSYVSVCGRNDPKHPAGRVVNA